MFRFHLLILPFVLLATGVAASEIRLTLHSAPGYAITHNHTLAAARFRIEEARARIQQAGRLANPTLELELNRNLRAPEGRIETGLVQSVPITARLRLERRVSQAELAAVEAEVRDAERRIAAEVGRSAVNLLALAAQSSLRERQLANTRELSGFTANRIATGEAAPVEASLIEFEAMQLQSELVQLRGQRADLVSGLRTLLGMDADTLPVITGRLPGIGGLPKRGVTPSARPDLAAAQRTAEAARLSTELARTGRWEDLSVGLNVSTERSEDVPEGFGNDTFAGVRFSLPLPFWNSNSGRIREAAAAAMRAGKEVDALEGSIQAEGISARAAMAILAEAVTALDDELLPQASQIEEQLRASYASGQTSLAEVLRAKDRRLLMERQRVDALRDYHLARIRLAAAMGQTIPHTSISP